MTAPLTGVAPAAAPAVLAPGVPAHPWQAEVLTPATLTHVAQTHVEAVATSADFVDFLTLPGYGLLP